MWGALIGAGASLLGSLFGKKEQKTTSSVDYVSMVREAEKAGFNPLTAIRNGGSAGFSSMTTSGAPLSSRIATGVADATQNFLANFDPFADQKREMETKLVEAQLANLQSSTALNNVRFGDVPAYTAGPHKIVMGSGVKQGQTFASVADVIGGPTAPEAGKTTYTNPWQSALINPAVRDAQNMEDRYGDSEIATMLYGGHVANADMRANSPRFTRFGDDIARAAGGLWDIPSSYDRMLDTVTVRAPWNVEIHPRSGRSAKADRLPYRPPLSP